MEEILKEDEDKGERRENKRGKEERKETENE